MNREYLALRVTVLIGLLLTPFINNIIVDTLSNGESFFHSNDVESLADFHIIGMTITVR